MANPSESIGPLEKLKRWIGGGCWMNTSSDPICESNYGDTSLLTSYCSKSLVIKKKVESEEDEIEQFKVHWSQLLEYDNDKKKVAEVSNVKVFKSLQRHPIWGQFFRTFGDGGIYDYGDLVVGEKFAKEGQVVLYHAYVTWKNEEANSYDEEYGLVWVLKVFKKGTFLKDLQKQWPLGMFKDYKKRVKHHKLGQSPAFKHTCSIKCGTLLADGRFGFLLMRETEDLRTFIDRKMKARIDLDCGPFPMELTFEIIYNVAKGVDWLHNLDIIHRDLKASNVLCSHFNKNSHKKLYDFYVADFECSMEVVGTSFFRAPEILQALEDKVVNKRPNLFTKA